MLVVREGEEKFHYFVSVTPKKKKNERIPI